MKATFNLVEIVVQDMAASLRFYRLLGVEIPAEADNEAHVSVALADGFGLAWDTAVLMEQIHGHWEPASGHRINLAFACENSTAVDAMHQKMVNQGYRSAKAPWDAFWGQRYAVLLDPDDNLIDLYAPLEG